MNDDSPHRLKVIAHFLGLCLRDKHVPTVEQIASIHAVASGALLNQIDGTDIPRFLLRRQAVQCLRCMVEIPEGALTVPNRCVDPKCPLSVFAKEPA